MPEYKDLGLQHRFEPKLSILGYAHNQGRGGALNYLETGESEKDGFETDALKYIEEVTRALS